MSANELFQNRVYFVKSAEQIAAEGAQKLAEAMAREQTIKSNVATSGRSGVPLGRSPAGGGGSPSPKAKLRNRRQSESDLVDSSSSDEEGAPDFSYDNTAAGNSLARAVQSAAVMVPVINDPEAAELFGLNAPAGISTGAIITSTGAAGTVESKSPPRRGSKSAGDDVLDGGRTVYAVTK